MQADIPFKDIRTLQPEEFIDILVHDLDVKGVVVGANYRFGAPAAPVVTRSPREVLKGAGIPALRTAALHIYTSTAVCSRSLGWRECCLYPTCVGALQFRQAASVSSWCC